MYTAAIAWLHLTAAAVWIGSQVFLILVAIPAVRAVEDPKAYRRALQVLTHRYNLLGWASLAVLVLTGLLRIFPGLPVLVLLADTFYGQVLLAKMGMGAGVLILTALHTLLIGPRLLALLPTEGNQPSAQYQELRRLSIVLSSLNLALSLGVLGAVVALRGAAF